MRLELRSGACGISVHDLDGVAGSGPAGRDLYESTLESQEARAVWLEVMGGRRRHRDGEAARPENDARRSSR